MQSESIVLKNAAMLTVAAHLAVATLHGEAHRVLHIGLSPFQLAFVIVVIILAPIVAALLLLLKRIHAGAFTLTISMFGSLIFGVWHHYIVISPDHISQVWYLPERYWSMMFQMTSAALAVIGVFGTAVGLRLLRPIKIG
jgi:hypothetical protein